MALYKYLKVEHARNLINGGIVRLGTLYEFRREEVYGEAVGDKEEGKKSSRLVAGDETWTLGNIPEFAKNFIQLSGGGTIRLNNSVFEAHQESPDYYVYCTTRHLKESLMAAFGCDAYVVIHDPDKFFRALSNSILSEATSEGAFPCSYGSRELPHQVFNRIHPALLKDPRYEYQAEVRALWRPRRLPIEPMLVMCPELSECCSLIMQNKAGIHDDAGEKRIQ